MEVLSNSLFRRSRGFHLMALFRLSYDAFSDVYAFLTPSTQAAL